LTTGLVGAAQAGNAAVALAMLRTAGARWSVTLDEAHAVLPSVTLPGRFQRSGNLILDVAHNADGMRSLVATIKEVKPSAPVTAILGVLNDKDWRQMMMILSTVVERFTIVAPPSAPPQRAWDPVDAESFARSNGLDARFEPDFARAIQVGRKAEGTCIVTGSFHTVGDALAIIGENTL
jgi:dihydrofolate synthase / folylpolyglutamate synthase